MNQIIQESFNQSQNRLKKLIENRKKINFKKENQDFHIEFSNEITEIPYGR